jgi:phage terminase small subunit
MLYELGVITMLDRAVLAGYCQAYGRWVEAERKLKETPALLKMPSGYVHRTRG